MTCPFYKYDHGNYCMACKKNITEDVYRNYCRFSSHDKCPIYKDAKR